MCNSKYPFWRTITWIFGPMILQYCLGLLVTFWRSSAEPALFDAHFSGRTWGGQIAALFTVLFVGEPLFGNARMEPLTFVDRVATLPARLRVLPEVEVLTFPYDQRDPDGMALLTEHCDAINARGVLTRNGRKL